MYTLRFAAGKMQRTQVAYIAEGRRPNSNEPILERLPVPISLFWRLAAAFVMVAVGACMTVLLLHGWFHTDFLPWLNITNHLGDAVGTVVIVIATFMAQQYVSSLFMRECLFWHSQPWPRTLLVRIGIAISAVACVAGITVYYLHTWFHSAFLPSLRLSAPIGDAIGTVIVVTAAFAIQRLVTIIFFRDYMYLLSNADHPSEGVRDVNHSAKKNQPGSAIT